jgi:heme exporter protein D
MNLGPHAAFILSAYAAAVGIVMGLVMWIVLDRRHLIRMLDDFDTQGITRRSARTNEEKS